MAVVDDTRQRLLETAGEIFAEKGFHATTVREIIARARVNIASVNYYFGDKERLYIEAVRQAAGHCHERVPLPQWPAGTPPTRKLRDFVHTFLSRVCGDEAQSWHGLLILREIFQPTPACAEFVERFVRPSFHMLLGILDELLPADVPLARRKLIGFSVVGQCLHYRIARPVVTLLVGDEEFRSYTVDHLTDHITAFTLAALGCGSPALGLADGPSPAVSGRESAADKGVG